MKPQQTYASDRPTSESTLLNLQEATQEKGRWCPIWNNELYRLYNDLNIVEDIKIRRLGWAGHIISIKEGRIPKKFLNGKFRKTKPVGRPRIRWEDAVQKGALQILWRSRAENGYEWRQLLMEAKSRYGLKCHGCMDGCKFHRIVDT
jgi:hypothetical protein